MRKIFAVSALFATFFSLGGLILTQGPIPVSVFLFLGYAVAVLIILDPSRHSPAPLGEKNNKGH